MPNSEPFISDYFTPENCFAEGMTVFNLLKETYTVDGINWEKIKRDHL